jgi:ubiquinone/menaquinone biosynthesis C-methylase UbiE
MSDLSGVEKSTGTLFGDLWHRYDDKLFEESVALFAERFKANDFDLEWFQGKRCLDVGCGGGRYTIAMARLGATEATGVDVSTEGLTDAKRRAIGMPNVSFRKASALELPFEKSSFDFVCCSGVLHHTSDPERGLQELVRVLKPGGMLFLLLYGKGGLRWPTIMQVRPHAQAIGYDLSDKFMRLAELPANKQRTFLDDLFVPIIGFYDWDEVQAMLADNSMRDAKRWERGKLDHEASIAVQRTELEQLHHLFETAMQLPDLEVLHVKSHVKKALTVVEVALSRLDVIESDYAAGNIDDAERQWQVFGWGHHRVLATKD